MTVQDYIFSAAIFCLALTLLWGLVVARRADRDNPDLESDHDGDRDREPGDDHEPDLNAESVRERQLRDYRDKYR